MCLRLAEGTPVLDYCPRNAPSFLGTRKGGRAEQSRLSRIEATRTIPASPLLHSVQGWWLDTELEETEAGSIWGGGSKGALFSETVWVVPISSFGGAHQRV